MNVSRRHVLVIGASGFFGAHLTAAFHAAGWSVVAGMRQPGNAWRLDRLAPTVRRIVFDLNLPREAMLDLLQANNITEIVNSAAYGVDHRQQDIDTAISVNVAGPVRLVEAAAAAGIVGMIHIGTSYEYGPHDGAISENTPLAPRGIYGATKAAGGLIAMERATARNLPLSILRPFTMFGPFEGDHKFTPLVASNVLAGKRVELTAGGQVRDYLYVGDAADACVMLLTNTSILGGKVFNVGSGRAITLRAFGDAIAHVAGGAADLLAWGARAYRPDEVMSMVADASWLHAATGWRPVTSLADGLRQTIAALDGHRSDRGEFGRGG